MTRSTTSTEDAVDRFYDEDGAAVELVQRLHGPWKADASVEWICSICGGMRLMIKSRFCPWCGAKMDEEAEE